MKVVLIGSGNVAWHIGNAMIDKEIKILQLFSPSHGKSLADEWNVPYINDLSLLNENADIYLFAIKEDAYNDIIEKFPFKNKCMIHTSGSVEMNVFETITTSYGVLYPFQTFTKGIPLAFNEVPLCMEANNQKTKQLLLSLAKMLSKTYCFIDSLQRKQLHLAGVFACNFTNVMYRIAKEILEENNMDFSILIPLINETARKVNFKLPEQVQTGPAIRNDKQIMDLHVDMIKNNDFKELYTLISKVIKPNL